MIAVADSDDGTLWRLAGLVGIGDPPRASAGDVVRRLGQAGIRVVLVTGDHPGPRSPSHARWASPGRGTSPSREVTSRT